jgi:putative hemolysin
MDDEGNSGAALKWLHNWRPGRHTYASIWLLTTLVLAVAVWLTQVLSFAFGTGLFALFISAVVLFGFILATKSLIFKDLLRQKYDDATTQILEYLPQQAASDGDVETIEIIENAINMRDLRAIDCMTPRSQVVQVSADVQHDILRTIFHTSKLSRILVTRPDDPEAVIGYVHVQQMLGQIPAGQLQQSMLPIDQVPSDTLANDLLSRFVRQRRNIACVVNEQVQWIGIVTLEDVLEELFGEIEDEYD